MREMPEDGCALLPAADGSTWLARRQPNGDLLVTEAAERGEPVRIEGVGGQWSATTDHAGIPWVVWSDEGRVFARRYQDGAWGPALQVSTQPDRALDPMVAADEYANVWIFWRYVEAAALWVCCMGPRSGQETLVARGTAPRLLRIDARQGTLRALYEEPGDRLMLATGTEHGGFGEPAAVA
jgi:hypothetical protein